MKNSLIINKGITLIALVITIIVLLILAGVSIAMLVGENGILTQAIEAGEKTQEAELDEKLKLAYLASYDNTGKIDEEKYLMELSKIGIPLNSTFPVFLQVEDKSYQITIDGAVSQETNNLQDIFTSNTTPHASQTTNTDIIGLDKEGNLVNMDLWEYTFKGEEDDDVSFIIEGTYGLNDITMYTTNANKINENTTSGYLGGYTSDGKIEGTVPQFIGKIEGGKVEYKSVTHMMMTFYQESELKIAPEIPDTVKGMNATFYECTSLTTLPSEIPDSVNALNLTFSRCSSLVEIPADYNLGANLKELKYTFERTGIAAIDVKIPDSVEWMDGSFRVCNNLVDVSALIIPKNVKSLNNTFSSCPNLEKGIKVIPENVTNIKSMFFNCPKLEGEMEINAKTSGLIVENSLKDYDYVFRLTGTAGSGIIISGNSPHLQEIIDSSVGGNVSLKN